MKKRIGFVLIALFVFLIVSCSKQDDIRFEIAEEIQVELDDYSKYYSFSNSVVVYCNEEKVDYPELTIGPADGETIQLGEVTFYVLYVHNKKEYKETFIVTFVDDYSSVTLHLFNETRTLQYRNGASLETLNQITVPTGFYIEGFYTDSSFQEPFSVSTILTKDIELYVKLTYSHLFTWQPANVDEIVTELNGYISSLMVRTSGYIPAWNQEGFKGRWNYIDGVFLNSIVNLYHETRIPEYKNFFLNYIDYYINSDGDFINPQTLETTGYRTGELDSVCESRVLFDAYEMTQDSRYLTAIEHTYQELSKMTLAAGTQNYSHKESYKNQIWLDGMYMYVPFLAQYAILKNDPQIFTTIKTQYEYIRNHMFDEDKKLYYHGHDTTKSIFWADTTTGNSKSFWLRSNGWFIVSLVDVLEYFPEGEDKNYLKEILVEALEGVLQYQDADTKLFYQLVDQGKTAFVVPYEYFKSLKNNLYSKDSVVKNYLESSGSSMIAYSLMKSARLGYISSKYQEVGKDIFEGIYQYSYKDGSLGNICITAGLGPETSPYRDGTPQYYLAEPVGKDDAKGVGPFLMAYLEYASLEGKLPRCYNVTFHRFDATYTETVYMGRALESIIDPDYPNYTFEGYYFDAEYKNPVPEGYQITKDIDIYLYFKKIPTALDILLDSDSILLKDDFDSYTFDDTLPEFQEWGTKGIYYSIHDKNEPGVDSELNHIILGDGTAYLFDASEYDGTQLIIDSGNITSGLVKGYMEVELQRPGNGWTFFQIHGTRADGTFGEIFGIRFENDELKYRINNGTAQTAESYIYPYSAWFTIEYEYDLNQKLLSVKVNDLNIVTDLSMETASSFGGIKIVTSDGWVHDSYGNLFHWIAVVDNVVIVVEE